MPNPIKGEVLIEINGEKLPLVFNYDAIAQIEAKYDESILELQLRLDRIEPMFYCLHIALGGKLTFDELKDAKKPPLLEVPDIIRKALEVSYFGDTKPEAEKDENTKKKP